jgi:hypothetical protein
MCSLTQILRVKVIDRKIKTGYIHTTKGFKKRLLTMRKSRLVIEIDKAIEDGRLNEPWPDARYVDIQDSTTFSPGCGPNSML